mgnify:CR=1 FL=1
MLLQALNSLRPGAEWSLNGSNYDDVVWHDTNQTKPTKQEVEAKVAELIADYESKQYQRDRVYPSIGDQLDALFHVGASFPFEAQNGYGNSIISRALYTINPKDEDELYILN